MQIPLPLQSPRKRIVKDAPVYIRGPTRGVVRYPVLVYGEDFVLGNADADAGADGEGEEDGVGQDDDNTTTATTAATTNAATATHIAGGAEGASTAGGATIGSASNAGEEGILLQDYHTEYQVFPNEAEIGDFPRCIPYNSERRVFADKTGRDFFEGKSPFLSFPRSL